ncbi:hypothetical protein PG990_004500 [Apiospora arundinis]
MAIRSLLYEGLAYILVCMSVVSTTLFLFVTFLLTGFTLSEPLFVVTHPKWLLPTLPGLFARPLLRQSRALILYLEQAHLREHGQMKNHPPLRWVIEYWCTIYNTTSCLIPDVEFWRHRKSTRSAGRRRRPLLHPFGRAEPLGGLFDQEMRESEAMYAEFRAGRLRPYLPRSGDLCRLYIGRENIKRRGIAQFVTAPMSPWLMGPLTILYPIWRMPFWNSLRLLFDFKWWNCIEEHFLWDVFFDMRDQGWDHITRGLLTTYG